MPRNGAAPVTNKDFCKHENIKDKYSSIQVCIFICVYICNYAHIQVHKYKCIPGDTIKSIPIFENVG